MPILILTLVAGSPMSGLIGGGTSPRVLESSAAKGDKGIAQVAQSGIECQDDCIV
jgi:hypothetical protein